MPEDRYFLLGDLFANVFTGIVVALCCAALIGPGWSMLVAMFVAMALGMLIALVLCFAFLLRFFGAVEVMVPVMQSGMWSGMVVGMRASMMPTGTGDAVLYGALIGLVVILAVWLLNTRLKGEENHG